MSQYIYLIAPLAGWAISQPLKLTLEKIGHKRLHLSDLMSSGNMPSSHMAGLVALLTVIGINEGVASSIFGLCFVFAVLVAYDSIGVRRTAAEGAAAVKRLSNKLGSEDYPKHIYKGHTPVEVFAGSLLGFIVGVLVNWVL